MLKIVVNGAEYFDEARGEFVYTNSTTLTLEHSLISLSKWESKWHKPFLGSTEKTAEELLDYIRCMTITQNVDPNVYLSLSQENFNDIKNYMEDTMTATWFTERDNPRHRQKVITAELIYYWMVALQIPFECEKWHLNRLLTLIRVCNIENSPKKKMGRKDVYRQNASLNEQRLNAAKAGG